MQANKELHVTNRDDWRAWLKVNHAVKKEIWLIYNRGEKVPGKEINRFG